MSATAPAAKLSPLEHEALLLRHQEAIALLTHPEVAGVTDLATTEQRVSLLAAVVWPAPVLRDWSLAKARAKLERRMASRLAHS